MNPLRTAAPPLLLLAAALPGCRRSDAAALPPHPPPALATAPAPGQRPRAPTPTPADATTFGPYRVHAREGTVFRRSDGRWIARASVTVTNSSNAPQTLARFDFASLEGMTPWPPATTVPEGTLAPEQSAAGDVAFVSPAAPEPPTRLRLYLSAPNTTSPGFVTVPLAPGTPRRPADTLLEPPPGFFPSLRALAPAGANTNATAPASNPALTLALADLTALHPTADGPWIVRATMTLQNNASAPVQINRALLSAFAPDAAVANVDARALAETHDAAAYAAALQARYTACQQGSYYYSVLPPVTTLAAGLSTSTVFACFEANAPPSKLEVRYGPGDQIQAQNSALVARADTNTLSAPFATMVTTVEY